MKRNVLPALVLIGGLVILYAALVFFRGNGPIPEFTEPDIPDTDIDDSEQLNDETILGGEKIDLPSVDEDSDFSVEAALSSRRSIRQYTNEPVNIGDISQLLWAAQGISGDDDRLRTTPSAGATYPLETYIVAGNVQELTPGTYKYDVHRHELEKHSEQDMRTEIYEASLQQDSIRQAPIVLVFTAVYERTTRRYGEERGIRYVHMEAGHASQNVYLQAQSLGLGLVTIGAFDDDRLAEVMELPVDERPLYVLPVGHINIR